MKTNLKYLFLALCTLLGSCYDDDVLSSKPGEPIEGISNLAHTISGDQVILTWDLPSQYPEGIITPVSVHIALSVDGQRVGGTIVLPNDPVTYTQAGYDPAREYRMTLKVVAMKNVENEPDHISDTWISKGTTLSI